MATQVLKFEQFIKENEMFNTMFNDNTTFNFTNESKKVLYKTILENCTLDLNESRNLERIINEETLYEGLFSKIADKTKEILVKVSDELKKAGKEFITELTNDCKKATSTSSKDLVSKVGNMGSKTKKSLKDEAKNISSTFSFYSKFATNGIAKMAETAYQQAFKIIKNEDGDDDKSNENFSMYNDAVFFALIETIKQNKYTLKDLNKNLDDSLFYLSENNLNENEHGVKIPFLSSIVKFLQKAPIFKQLAQLEEKAAKITKNTLHKASVFCKTLGGPGVFEFLVISTLVGAVVEFTIKTELKHAIVVLIPGVGSILGVIKTVALGLTIVATIQHLLKDGDDEHGDKHGEDKNED